LVDLFETIINLQHFRDNIRLCSTTDHYIC